MPATNVCSYEGCANTKKKRPDLSFHRFPTNQVTQLDWIVRSGNPDFCELSQKQLGEKRICSEHFLEQSFHSARSGRPLLNSIAVPIDCAFSNQIEKNANVESSQNLGNQVPAQLAIDLPEPANTATVDSSNRDLDCIPPLPAHPPTSPDLRPKNHKLTPREKRLTRKIEHLTSQLRAKVQRIRRLTRTDLTKKPKTVADVIDGASKFLNPEQLSFFKMQLNHSKLCKWTEDEKQYALSLYYKSPKAYVFLRDVKKMSLPCVTLIRKWINELNLTTGLRTRLFDRLKEKAQTMTKYERDCVLMWDEMSIKVLLEYNPKEDLVEGFQDLGELGRSNKLARYALVFMLRGLRYSWKQPIAYFVSHGNLNGTDLKTIISAVISKVSKTGLTIGSMVCDQGAANRGAVSALGVTKDQPFIEVDGRKIFFNYDVPHLIKSIRNNLLTKDFLIDGQTISWGAIRELREVERDKPCRAAPKLTDRHIMPNNFQRMNVSLATQVFSASVAAAMNTGNVTGQLVNPNCVATANFVKRLNDIFDCLNSRYPNDPNPLKCALSSTRPQVQQYLETALPWLEKLRLSDNKTLPPCFGGLILSVKSILMLWEEMKGEESLFLMTSRLNQDPIENLFAVLRDRSGHNDNPSVMQIRRNLQYSMTVNLMKPPSGTNCEIDDGQVLLAIEQPTDEQTFENSVDVNANKQTDTTTITKTVDIDASIEDNRFGVVEIPAIQPASLATQVTLETCSMKYVAGYLAYKCLLKFNCENCRSTLTKDNQNLEQTDELLIFWRAYATKDGDQLGNLKVPSDDFNSCVISAYDTFSLEFRQNCHKNQIAGYLGTCIRSALTNNETCSRFWVVDGECWHHREFIIDFFVRVHIFYNLKWISRDLRDKKRSSVEFKSSRKLLKVTHQ